MPNVSFKIPLQHIHLLDELVAEGLYTSRGEAIREGIHNLLIEILNMEEENN